MHILPISPHKLSIDLSLVTNYHIDRDGLDIFGELFCQLQRKGGAGDQMSTAFY